MNNRKALAILTILAMVLSTVPMAVPALEYSMDTSLAKSAASFIGGPDNNTGYAIAIAGDVNGDGYDDIVLGAFSNSEAGKANAGKTYLFFGKASGWAMDTSIEKADASFRGESASDMSGISVAGAGDVNKDGFDDFIIGCAGGMSGCAYLILGKASGWAVNVSLSTADASFVGEHPGDAAGRAVAGAGDVNKDGYDDILVGAHKDKDNGVDSGQTYLIFGKKAGWAKNTNLATANASYWGQHSGDTSGRAVAGAGDVNKDGFDDFLIGAESNAEVTASAGQTYLILGKASGWAMDVNLSAVDASFLGEGSSDYSGRAVAGAGDVNGDGFDDIMIGAPGDNPGGMASGQTYLILGKASGWAMDTSLSASAASFWGENALDNSGFAVSVKGDVNMDGFDDILIGAYGNSEAAAVAGQSYLILGKASGWAMDTGLSTADASFRGEHANDYAGGAVSGGGDVNGDGYADILIGAQQDVDGGIASGQTYLIFPVHSSKPTAVASVKIYLTSDYLNETDYALQGDTLYIEFIGTDGNASMRDLAVGMVKSDLFPVGFKVILMETGVHTGIYRGAVKVMNGINASPGQIGADTGDVVTALSFADPTKNDAVTIGKITLMKGTPPPVTEDVGMNGHVTVSNVTNPRWVFETNAAWLDWNVTTQNVSGIPDNSEVGSYWAHIFVYDALGRSDDHNVTITVVNVPPVIETADVVTVDEDEYYEVDYNSTDDGQGVITWHLDTDADWLEIDLATGILNGTPVNSNVGSWYVNVSVDDGNGGTDYTNFTLEVVNFNDKPTITTTDVTTATEGVKYQVDYQVTDVDAGDVFTWSLKTDAKFLKINATGSLNGTPSNDDVGSYYVNVTVKDQDGLSDYHNFTLVVGNVNQAPVWKDVPPAEVKINSLQTYTFDVNATDIDVGDKLYYGAIMTPTDASLAMNLTTGVMTMGPLDAGVYSVNLSCTDSAAKIYFVFKLNVTHKNSPPTALLVGPIPGATITTAKPTLQWTTADFDTDKVTVDLYVSDVKANVDGKVASAKLLSASSAKTYAYTTYLVPGKTYYWTVVPFDGNDTGTCLNATASFTVASTAKVNHAPTISPPAKVPDATATKDYKLTVAGADQDASTTLTYSLTGAPAGMSISNAGVITWKPTKDQAKTGTFTFNVVVSDSEFSASTPITVKVKKAPEGGMGSYLWLIILVIIILVVVVAVAVMMSGKKKGATDEEEGEEVGEEE